MINGCNLVAVLDSTVSSSITELREWKKMVCLKISTGDKNCGLDAINRIKGASLGSLSD